MPTSHQENVPTNNNNNSNSVPNWKCHHFESKLDSRYSNSFPSFSVSNDDEKNAIRSSVSSTEIHALVSKEDWYKQTLSVIVIGASGDLAKKKTYPSLLGLFVDNLLPVHSVIWGFARSVKSHDELRAHLYPHLITCDGVNEIVVQQFLSKCFYHSGKSYGDVAAYSEMVSYIQDFEKQQPQCIGNRLFYLAIPPNVFGETGNAIHAVGMASRGGWTRLIIEKPFGRDLHSCNNLLQSLAEQFDEDQLYRIDHYLGKEIVQNLLLFRFGNAWTQFIWNSNAVESVKITFKEPFGTDGRGGYFDHYGIIRDIIQNHLLQILTLIAMEPPTSLDGDAIRTAKCQVLQHMEPIVSLEGEQQQQSNVLLGQYNGYKEDPTISNKDTICPTYAAIRTFVNTPRWEGVPFVLEAGKALDERLCEVRITLKSTRTMAALSDALDGDKNRTTSFFPSNQLVLRLQPSPSIELLTNMKTPGFSSLPLPNVPLQMNYSTLQTEEVSTTTTTTTTRTSNTNSSPDAYTRLLLNAMRGHAGSFVRDDELRRSWEIFTPLLHQLERDGIRPHEYEYGSKGPEGRDEWMNEMLLASQTTKTKNASTTKQNVLFASL